MIGVTGVLGQPWRADVTAHGSVVPWDGSTPLEWYVAADDRWHVPAEDVTIRHTRLLGAAVFETRLRVPGGDVVQRIWSVADHEGLTVVDVANDSSLPVACAFTRPDLLTVRPVSGVPIRGIDLPATSVLLPIGHRSSVRVALAHRCDGPGRLPADLPPPEAVARGWLALSERASRLVLPDGAATEAVVAARVDLALTGPEPSDSDPVAFLLGVGELVRMGELEPSGMAAEVADAVEEVAGRAGWDVDAALDAAASVFAAGAERQAVRDVLRIIGARVGEAGPVDRPTGVRGVAAVERRVLRGPVLFPDGYPPEWRGIDIEAHHLPAGPATTLSMAVRWHGHRPALLWQVDGDPVELSAPAVDGAWRTGASSGEVLWRLDPPS